MPKAVHLDTNSLIHFKLPNEYDMESIVSDNEIALIIPFGVVGELDQLKYSGPHKNVRERAKLVLKKLDDWIRAGTPVRKGLPMRVGETPSQADLDKMGLDARSSDDRILASIILYRDRHPDEGICVITNDLGLTLRLDQYKIEHYSLPESLQLPEPLDALEKKILQLEKERDSRRLPDLSVSFEDGQQRTAILIQPTTVVQREDVDDLYSAKIAEAKYERYLDDGDSIEEVDETEASKIQERLLGLTGRDLLGIDKLALGYSQQEIQKFRRSLLGYRERLAEFIEEKARVNDSIRRSFALSLFVSNVGTSAATKVSIVLSVPDSILFIENDDLELPPEVPALPSPPRSMFDNTFPLFDTTMLSSIGKDRELADLSHLFSRDPHQPVVEYREHSVTIELDEVMHHGRGIPLPQLFLRFVDEDAVGSFAISATVHCREIIDPIEHELGVLIVRDRALCVDEEKDSEGLS